MLPLTLELARIEEPSLLFAEDSLRSAESGPLEECRIEEPLELLSA